MPRKSKRQKRTVKRVMHEYKHGELSSGKKGKGGKVKSRKQAIAIAMSEAGTSKNKSSHASKRSRRHARDNERSGHAAQ